MQAAKRDLQKIQMLRRPVGTPKETAVSYLRQIQAKGIRFETVNSICKALDCQPGDLLEDTEDDD